MGRLQTISDALATRKRAASWELRSRLRALRKPPFDPDDTPRLPWHWALDVVAVCAVVGLAVRAWLLERAPYDGPLPDGAPGWARMRDMLLEGPDAGAWASNANALLLGRYGDLDAHRLPVYPYLIWVVAHVYPDVALAGHVVTHACYLLLGPIVYALGRRWMNPGLAFGAAVTAVLFPAAVQAGQRYGVDPVVTTVLPLALLGADLAAYRWWAALLGGLLVGMATSTHLTTIGLPVVGLLLCLFRGKPGVARWLGALAFAGGVTVGVGAMFWNYPTLPIGILPGTIAEGVAPHGGAGQTGFAPATTSAWQMVQAGLPIAMNDVMRFVAVNTRGTWIPWTAALVFPWLGLLGRSPGERGRLEWRRIGTGLAIGLPLAIALVPLLAFAAAKSPTRYTENFFPLVLLLVFRGFDAAATLVEVGVRRVLPGWPLGVVGVVVGLAAAWGLRQAPHGHDTRANPADIAAREVGAALLKDFGPGGGAACSDREIDAYAGRIYCPHSPMAIFNNNPEPIRALLTAECSGEGPVPYVILERPATAEPVSTDRVTMDAWVIANGELKDEVNLPLLKAHIYAVERVTGPPPKPI